MKKLADLIFSHAFFKILQKSKAFLILSIHKPSLRPHTKFGPDRFRRLLDTKRHQPKQSIFGSTFCNLTILGELIKKTKNFKLLGTFKTVP